MNRTLLLAVISTISLASQAQKSSVKSFAVKIEGSLGNSSQKHVFLHHQEAEVFLSDSLPLTKGLFKYQGKLTEPRMFWINSSRDPGQQPNLIFFVDETPVNIKLLAGDSLVYSTVKGGQNQQDYMEYKLMISNFVSIQQRMQNDFNEAAQRGDYNAQNAIRAEYDNLNKQYLAGIKNFIKTHPRSAMSAQILNNDLNNPAIPISEVEESLSYLDPVLNENSNVKATRKRLDDKRGTMVGYPAANFAQPDPQGKLVNLSDFKGKYVLVDFWASWCRPCRMENPNVVAVYNKYKHKDFTVLGVSMDSNRDPWLAAIQQDNLTWTHVSDLKGWGNEAGKLYGISGIPANLLIDKEGKIIAKDLRGPALDEKLAEVIK
ncbi:MAG TPA: TlpA disulfide reductase family protein [Bacteroidia bacterium]|nr:TlpA disulfide reductase family protein [Bacteroidia bacterium]